MEGSGGVSPVSLSREETNFEYISDAILGLAFAVVAIVAAQRMSWSKGQGGTETNVVTAFYLLILCTSFLRTIWFLIPNSVMVPSYVPVAVMAFDKEHPSWLGAFLSEILKSVGSLFLFSIFILILVYWADILKKYFQPGARRSRPMTTFIHICIFLFGVEMFNAFLFLMRAYSSEAMLLVNSILLSIVSIVCVFEITIFSHKFRTVLQTLGAINQISTESQVKRIVWITVTGNLFFFTRALLETGFAGMLLYYYSKHGTVAETFSHALWDTYMSLKHWSEVAILGLMLYILQSRFTATGGFSGATETSREGYQKVPDTEAAAK